MKYAFSRVTDGPKWDGKEEPRLLHKGTSTLVSGPPKVKTLDIPEYSWVDGKKNVKVYIDTEFLELEINENHVELTHTENSFCVTISLPNKKYKLSVSALHKPISSSAFVLKNRRITVSLQKSDEDSSWYKLHDS